jgi:hypothetical protein
LKVPEEHLSYTELELKPELTYEKKPTKILDEKWKHLRNRALNIVKYSGRTIPREKPHGRKRTFYAWIILISSGT